MNITIAIKKALLDKHMTQTQLAEILGTSKQILNRTIGREVWKTSDLEKIANAIGYNVKIQLIDAQTGKIIEVE